MKKIALFLVTICSFSLGAYFLGSSWAKDAVTTAKPNPILAELEQKAAENPENILEIIAETKELINSGTKDEFQLARARIKLDRAISIFYKSHLREIAEKLAAKNGVESYRAAYEKQTVGEIKAEPSVRYRNVLEAQLLASPSIDPSSEAFKSYVYVAGKSKASGNTATGSLSKETMRVMLAAEKGVTANTGALLDDDGMKTVFGSINLKPWSEADLRTLRKIILTEWLGIDTKITRAYVTASIDFKGKKTNRIYLKESLKHTKQKESLSCEANSIADLSNYYRGRAGKERTNETAIFASMPKDESLPDLIKEDGRSVRIWADPDKVFVGKVEGVQSININKLTGYGIHPRGALPVVQNELSAYGYTANIEKLSAFNVLWSLYRWEPVLFWYVLSEDPKKGFSKIEWRTPEGKQVSGYIGEHTGIIVGAELSKNGDLLKVGYYEGRTENVIWETFETIEKKASYFEWAIFPTKTKKQA